MAEIALEVGTSRLSRDAAVRQFCEAEYARVAGYCYRLVGDEQLAHDLAQEAFVRLFGRWFDVREPRAYIYVLATNLARREWRTRSAERAALARVAASEQPVSAPEPGIRDVVERLPNKWRDVVLLHYYADLPVAEVARQLKQPEGTVKRLLNEARGLLARSLSGVA